MALTAHRFLIVLAALLRFAVMVHADDPSPTTTSVTNTFSNFPSMTAIDGLGVSAGGVGSQDNGDSAGASGSDVGTFNLSTGGIVAIAVSIGVVVVGIIAMWALWFIAKRRQWTIKQTLKHASTRVVTAMTPRTPRAPRAQRPGTSGTGSTRRDDVEAGGSRFFRSKASQPLPQEGWLEGEKERSRSRSPEYLPKPNAKKFGFAFK